MMKKFLGRMFAATAAVVSCASPAFADCTLADIAGDWKFILEFADAQMPALICDLTISVSSEGTASSSNMCPNNTVNGNAASIQSLALIDATTCEFKLIIGSLAQTINQGSNSYVSYQDANVILDIYLNQNTNYAYGGTNLFMNLTPYGVTSQNGWQSSHYYLTLIRN